MKENISHEIHIVRKATKEHAGDIVRLLFNAWVQTYVNSEYQITELDIQRKFGDLSEKIQDIGQFIENSTNQSNINYLVAIVNGEVSGFIYATKNKSELYINALYVDPNSQRGGIGTSLLHETINNNQMVDVIVVDVVSYNEKAIAFYEKNGFIKQGQSNTAFSKFPDGKVVPEIRMIKK